MLDRKKELDLSVVIIARNEEGAIGPCIESVVRQTEGLKREIILVDSASTDRTVEIASGYPVTVIRIDECSAFSPAAGRYLGTLHARGEFIFFIDGDMILVDEWIEQAMARLAQEPNVAAVAGGLFRVFPGEEQNFAHPNRYDLGAVAYIAAAGVYRRDVLARVGSFHPFMKGEEERELGYRINQAGYTILRLDVPMVYHLEKTRTQGEVDEKATYFTGVGQIFRHYGMRSITGHLLIVHRRMFALQLAGVLLLVALFVEFFWRELGLFEETLGGLAIVLVALMALKGKRKVYLFLRQIVLTAVNVLKGFGLGIPPAETFQAKTSVIAGVMAQPSA